jgi:ABC-type tungstate transport system substrate-binding protein
MRKHASFKFCVGIAAAAPLLAILLGLVIILFVRSESFPLGTLVIIAAWSSLGFYTVALGYLLYFLEARSALDTIEKGRWTLIMLFSFPVGALVFWYRYVWREQQ